ncbi:FMN-dependent NADH-azoreductase [Azohydromonas caseinilytica]|uniref:FMN dependent NADH:quinone oxidoreductase n=1 Tax=Azohydromonas caseinilytica TaxID=2728836 RepID=A0A848FCI8_9BURK|nr:NAD(P)H-dependent oxidoreductase [Azohydromonas caseinilytica]NML15671.1 FMN-dependent NADH-azoreductase [Azohydromonas caseinilytica]
MKVLHLDSSPLGTASVTREVTATLAAAYRAAGATVSYRDLAAQPLAHLGGELLQALRPAPGAPAPEGEAVARELALTEELLAEFLGADVVVVGAPMYNFSVPTQLKAWIDRIAQAGRTFRYTAQGPQGLAGGRKVVIVSSRGGRYAGTPAEAALDHQEAYLRTVFGFLGITDVEVIRTEGVGLGAEARAAALAQAKQDVQAVAAVEAEAA